MRSPSCQDFGFKSVIFFFFFTSTLFSHFCPILKTVRRNSRQIRLERITAVLGEKTWVCVMRSLNCIDIRQWETFRTAKVHFLDLFFTLTLLLFLFHLHFAASLHYKTFLISAIFLKELRQPLKNDSVFSKPASFHTHFSGGLSAYGILARWVRFPVGREKLAPREGGREGGGRTLRNVLLCRSNSPQ